jgi:RNA polymerase sigma-70 factor (ECF subfamily)
MSRADSDPLIQGLAAGLADAFAVLYDRFGKALLQVALAILSSRHDAEDAVQDVFVNLVRARESLSGVENLRAYVFTSLRNSALKIVANRKAASAVMAADLNRISSNVTDTVDIDRSVRLEQALRALPLEQREVIALKVDAGLTFAEIASALGLSANTAASRYRYALEKLRIALKE